MRLRGALALVALLIAPLPGVRAADVAIVRAFPADKGPGYRKPAPDAAGAVGPHHAVVLDDRAFVAVDKATGNVVRDLTQHDFWLGVQPVRTLDLQANDPRILYDPLSGRWIAWVQGVDPMNGYLAVSTTSDPTGDWKGVKFPIPPHNYGAKAGLDKNGFYLTLHNGRDDTHKAHTCYAIPKADLIASNGPDLSHLQTFPGLEIESFPATDLDPDKAPDAPEVLLNKEFGNVAGKLYMYKITWSGTRASISDVQTIPLSTTYSCPSGSNEKSRAVQPAPGGKLRADEARRTDCVFAHGGSVFGCNGAKRTLGPRAPGILWFGVRVSDGALLQRRASSTTRPAIISFPRSQWTRTKRRRPGLHEDVGEGVPVRLRHDARGGRPGGFDGGPCAGGARDDLLSAQSAGPSRDRVGQLLDDVRRPFGPEPALDLPGVREQHGRSPVVHGLGRLPTQGGNRVRCVGTHGTGPPSA